MHIFLISVACLDSPAPGTLKRQIIEKEDISLTGIACYSLSQQKLFSMALELMLSLLILLPLPTDYFQIYATYITKGCAETSLDLRKWLTKTTRLNQSRRLLLCCAYLNSEADIANAMAPWLPRSPNLRKCQDSDCHWKSIEALVYKSIEVYRSL